MAEAGKDILWNSISAIADDSVLTSTGITVAQETVYSKLIRKMIGKRYNKGWMELLTFSLLTAQTDAGMGAWYGERPSATQAGFGDVLKEVIRPVVSCLFNNYVVAVGSNGFHNPLKTFGFVDLLIMLVAKDLAYGGKAVLAQNSESMAQNLAGGDNQFARQTLVSRLLANEKAGRSTSYLAKKEAQYSARKSE